MENKDILDGSTLEAKMKELSLELERTYQIQSAIKREGDKIIIPTFMSFGDAASAILSYERDMEKVESKALDFEGHRSDLLVALQRAMTTTFGNAVGNSVQTFFGTIPGAVRVNIDWDEAVTVPYGEVVIPGLPVSFSVGVGEDDNDPPNPMKSRLYLRAKCKRKFMPLVDRIGDAVRLELANNSIFKGKAIDSKFNFLNVNGFPESRIIHSKQEEMDLEANILSLIRHRGQIKETNVSLKRTVLFHGPYGTGKTLTALKIAKQCRDFAWTFLNVVPGDNDFATALNFAKRYQPCVVFFEDIDQITSGVRDTSINTILNTVDGILSKTAEVITIMTTNHIESVDRAMLRPGRIDAILELGKVDEHALEKLVSIYTKDQVTDLNVKDLMDTIKGYTPAFIAEGCQRAVLYAMAKGHTEITHEDLKFSLGGLRSQFEMMMQEKVVKEDTLDKKFTQIVKGAMGRK